MCATGTHLQPRPEMPEAVGMVLPRLPRPWSAWGSRRRASHFPGVNDLRTRLAPPGPESSFTTPTPGAYQSEADGVRPREGRVTSTRTALYFPAGTSTSSSPTTLYVTFSAGSPSSLDQDSPA